MKINHTTINTLTAIPNSWILNRFLYKCFILIIGCIFTSLILFSCTTNVTETKLDDNKNNSKPKSNEISTPINQAPNTIRDVDKIENTNKNKDITIGERKIREREDYSTIRDFKLFNGDKGLLLLESGDVLSISGNKLEKIDQLERNNEGYVFWNDGNLGINFSKIDIVDLK